MSFRDRVVVVTGGGTGVGRATAIAFAGEGARVALFGRRIEPLTAVARDIEAEQGEAFVRSVDVTDPEAVTDGVAEVVRRFGRIDVLVNNAAWVPAWTAIHETPLETWEKALATNLTSHFLVARATLPQLAARRGCIVNVSSISAQKSANSVASYAAAKAGLIALTRCIAAEYGWQGVRCNCVVPSWIETDMTAAFLSDPATREAVEARHALRRVARPDEIARVILHLAGADASFVTGTEYMVDGGMRAL